MSLRRVLGLRRKAARETVDFPRSVEPTQPRPIPDEERCVIDLSQPETSSAVKVNGTFGKNCSLTVDRRIPKSVPIVVRTGTPKPPTNVSLSIGNVRSGRVVMTIAGSDVDMAIGDSPRLFTQIGMGKKSRVKVGHGTTSSGIEISCEAGAVSIGAHCQTASQTMVMGAAHHGIVDLSDGEPALVPQDPDVRVGDHVWLGFRSYVGGNADIGSGCIVAAQSSVVAPMPPDCLIAGNPAKVRRRDVGWSRVPHELDPASKGYFDALLQERAETAPSEFNLDHEDLR